MSLNPANAAHSISARCPVVYVRGQANAAQLRLSDDAGAAITPTAATYTLYDRNGVSATSGSATIAAGVLSYVLTSTHIPATATLGGYWVERWLYTVDGVQTLYEREVLIALRDLPMPVQLADIAGSTGRYTTLNNQLPRVRASWGAHLTAAWAELLRRLDRDGLYTSRLLSPGALYDAMEHATLARIFADLAATQADDSPHAKLSAHHAAAADKAYDQIRSVLSDAAAQVDHGDVLAPARSPTLAVNVPIYPWARGTW
jgi:hypothetical protein